MDARTRETLAQVAGALEAASGALAVLLDGQAKPAVKPAVKPARKVTRAPARVPARKAGKPDDGFAAWLRDTAPARHARKDRNRTLAKALDEQAPGWRGASNRGEIWAAAKAGTALPEVTC